MKKLVIPPLFVPQVTTNFEGLEDPGQGIFHDIDDGIHPIMSKI